MKRKRLERMGGLFFLGALCASGPCEPDPGPADLAVADLRAAPNLCPSRERPAGRCAPGDSTSWTTCSGSGAHCFCAPLESCQCLAPEAQWQCCPQSSSFDPCPTTPVAAGAACCGKPTCDYAKHPAKLAVRRCACPGNHLRWACQDESAALALVEGDAVVAATALWGSAADDVWLGREDGRLAHWDGQGWTLAPAPRLVRRPALWGSGRDDVWAGGIYEGELLHFDGRAWQPAALAPETGVAAIGGRGPRDVWVATSSGSAPPRLHHFDGAAWTTLSLGFAMDALLGTQADMWAAGSGFLFRWDGAAWVPVHSTQAQRGYALAASGPRDVWAFSWESRAPTIHWDGAAWTDLAAPKLNALLGFSATDLWGTSSAGLLHYDGVAWKVVEPRGGAGALWGTPGLLWLVSANRLSRYLF